jgi:hypothetical protein
LIYIIRKIPELQGTVLKSFKEGSLLGKFLVGYFYVVQTISLSFRALGVNYVIVAVICVLSQSI